MKGFRAKMADLLLLREFCFGQWWKKFRLLLSCSLSRNLCHFLASFLHRIEFLEFKVKALELILKVINEIHSLSSTCILSSIEAVIGLVLCETESFPFFADRCFITWTLADISLLGFVTFFMYTKFCTKSSLALKAIKHRADFLTPLKSWINNNYSTLLSYPVTSKVYCKNLPQNGALWTLAANWLNFCGCDLTVKFLESLLACVVVGARILYTTELFFLITIIIIAFLVSIRLFWWKTGLMRTFC